MTPERIEEIKQTAKQMGLIPALMASDLLAALEESQQQKVTLKEELEDKINESNEFYKWWQEEVSERNIYKHELAEAQQTIARQREVLEFYANQEHWELPSFGRGQSKVTSDRGSKARELLKEGSDKA